MRGVGSEFVGISHFVAVLSDDIARMSAWNMVVFIVVSTVAHLGLGVGISLVLMSVPNKKFRDLIQACILIPWAVPPVVVGFLWRIIYQPQFSPISVLASTLLGVSEISGLDLLSRPNSALMGVIIANIWSVTPFYMLMILARLQNIPLEILNAAAIDGANGFQQFAYVTLPELKGTLGTLAIFDIIGTSVYFDLIWVMTKGGPGLSSEVLATYIYKQAFQKFEFGRASAAGLLLFVIIMVVSSIVAVITRED